MSRPRDDVAQVVLRSLLAGPLLGLCAALLAASSASRAAGPLLLAGVGAGLGGALALSGAELALLATRRRWPRAPWPLALAPAAAVLALLSPALLLGAEFVLLLSTIGPTGEATALLGDRHEHAPEVLLDPDAALSCVLVLGATLAGRLRGWSLARRAAAGVWLVLAGAALRLALGRLETLQVGLSVGVEAALAALAPYELAAADQAVREVRTQETAEPASPADHAALGRLVGAPLVVAAWTLARVANEKLGDLARATARELAGLVVAVVVGLVVLDLRLGRAAAGAGAVLLVVVVVAAGQYLAPIVVGVTLAATVPALRAVGALVRARFAGATTSRHVSPLLLGLAVAGGCAALGGRASGATLRVEASAWLGVAPVQVYRHHAGVQARLDAVRRANGWVTLLFQLDLEGRREPPPASLLRAAAALGEASAAIELAADPGEERGVILGALSQGVAAGDVFAAAALLEEPTASGSARDEALDLALARARIRGDDEVQIALARGWARCPSRRAEVEALLAEDPDRWTRALWALLRRDAPARVGRPLLLAVAAAAFRPPGARSSGHLPALLDHEPGFATPEHLELLGSFTPGPPAPGWEAPLAGLDLRPLDAGLADGAATGLAAVARGAWAEAWATSGAALDADPRDPGARRARAHALLAVARGELFASPARSAGLCQVALARARRLLALDAEDRRAAPELPAARREPVALFDELLLRLHERLSDPGRAAEPLALEELHVALELVVIVAREDDAPTHARAAALRADLLTLGAPPVPERLASLRQRLGRQLLAEAQRASADAERLLRAASRLGVTP